jgi:hypothetical protein
MCSQNYILYRVSKKTNWTLFDFMERKSYKSYRKEIKIIAFSKYTNLDFDIQGVSKKNAMEIQQAVVHHKRG